MPLLPWRITSRYTHQETLARLRARVSAWAEDPDYNCVCGEVSDDGVLLGYNRTTRHSSATAPLFRGKWLKTDDGEVVLDGAFGLSLAGVFLGFVALGFFIAGSFLLLLAATGFYTGPPDTGLALAFMGGLCMLPLVGVGALGGWEVWADRRQIIRVLHEVCQGQNPV